MDTLSLVVTVVLIVALLTFPLAYLCQVVARRHAHKSVTIETNARPFGPSRTITVAGFSAAGALAQLQAVEDAEERAKDRATNRAEARKERSHQAELRRVREKWQAEHGEPVRDVIEDSVFVPYSEREEQIARNGQPEETVENNERIQARFDRHGERPSGPDAKRMSTGG